MTHKIEWHYDEKPPREGCYLVAYTFQYMPRGATQKKTNLLTTEAIYTESRWLSMLNESELTTVYAWAPLPAAPPTKP